MEKQIKPAPPAYLASHGLIRRDELAADLRVSEQTIALWEKTGLPVLRVGDQRLYDLKQVVAWIRKVGKPAAA